ncbi:tRNA methyltransferase 1 [Thoreauomyces humboldtii]|nr:tRNA methyltransferase 1 [Thoreauomyces humboldtii]
MASESLPSSALPPPTEDVPAAKPPTKTEPTPSWKSYGPDGVFITEGKARIKFPSENSVFYNPVQQFNRDMSIAAITAWSKMFFMEKLSKQKRSAPVTQETVAKSVTPTEVELQTLATPAEERSETPAEEKAETNAQENDAARIACPQLPPVNNSYTADYKPFDSASLEDPDLDSEKYAPLSFTILEALSATGLRSIRYAKDIKGIKSILANDLLEDAVEAIKQNVTANDVDHIVIPNLGDAA